MPPAAVAPPLQEKHPILAAIQANKVIPLKLYLLRRQAEELALVSGFDHLMCLPVLKGVDSYGYQEYTVLHVLRELGGRALLADEVGLGKTIEAGIVLKELHVRGLVRRVLILVPASLVTQWRDELAAKFHLRFEVGKEAGDWRAMQRIVTSIDTAKSAEHMAEIQAIKWDLLVVDEAHKLKDKRTLNWKLVNGIPKRYILMLSATPFQNDLLELFNMITILRPGQLYTEREFRQKFLKRGNARQARDPQELRRLLRQVMVRNRRGEVGVRFTQRVAETTHLEMFEPERKLYDAAVRFCRQWFGLLYGNAAGLVAIGYLKQLCSSSFSFRESLVGNVLPRAQKTNMREVILDAEELLSLADAVKVNVKLEALTQLLKSHQDKELVFTQYRGTQDFVTARLRVEGIPHAAFNGSLGAEEKDRAIGQFRRDARVLVSTESGGEGRNLQFAFRLVNYDLPWNPMRVEQRIGRIHRIGQTHDVFITSLACRGTVEDYLLQLLEHKLNLFRLVVGEVDGILGKLRMDEHIAKLFLESRDDAAFKKRMEEFGEELVAMRTRYEQCREDNDLILGGLTVEGTA
jgi:SNF2 family DNA or RNA helicase